ncbi:hypothetical protein JDV02_003421 [Purpureocillium takamizusanense]|uniref:AB hydrolase-1 domain-containing protein n=1 Tax=Purpureocillium takamizusanense TaxID=2060973 RepID=A0A9Q8V9R2_9HYPO|nr:uncharacterized protein JDV02_003421 [Purpureocillium takamizusanense]UNI17042.1 hypothetical protein JDV02_003421 [Purpureocillium takamizusanense]
MAFQTAKKEFEIQPDIRLHAEISFPAAARPQGALSDTTLVLLHFWGGSSSTWAQFRSLLAPRFPVVALDFRGWGQSTGPDNESAYSIAHLADDVEFVIRALGLTSLVLVGHSMGAKVAQLVAGRKCINGLLGLVLVSPAPPSPLELPPEMREQQLHAYDTPKSAELVTRNVLTASPLQQGIVDSIVTDMLRGNNHARAAWPGYGMSNDVAAEARQIDVPVLVVGAIADIVEPIARIKQEVCTVIPHAGLVTLHNSGHLIPIEAPAELDMAVSEFLQRLKHR